MDIVVLYKQTERTPMKIIEKHLLQMKHCADSVYYFESEAALLESEVDADVLVSWGGSGPQPEEFCRRSKHLKWFHSLSAGVNAVLSSSIGDLDITITNASGIHGKPMGITVMGYIISHLRRFPEMREHQSKHIWAKPNDLPEEPDGKTLGIIGAGAIGRDIAAYAKALGFRVIGVKRTACPMENFDLVVPAAQMQNVLHLMDYVVMLTPLTNETKGLANRTFFTAMKAGSYFINVSRGAVVDTDALAEVLQSGHICGAALDAVDPEPLPSDHPLWDVKNVFITPHYSASSPIYMDRAVDQFLENVKNFKNGLPLFNVVKQGK